MEERVLTLVGKHPRTATDTSTDPEVMPPQPAARPQARPQRPERGGTGPDSLDDSTSVAEELRFSPVNRWVYSPRMRARTSRNLHRHAPEAIPPQGYPVVLWSFPPPLWRYRPQAPCHRAPICLQDSTEPAEVSWTLQVCSTSAA